MSPETAVPRAWMVGALLVIAAAASVASAAVAAPPADARPAVVRALPSLQRSAKTFVANRSCVSCHHNILPILTLRLAASRGFEVDKAILSEVERKTFRVLTNPRAFDDAVQGTTVSDPTPNDSWLLVAAKAAGLAPDVTRAVYAKRIASWQRGGHWTTSDFRPPHSSSLFTATATAVLAIRAYFPDEMRPARDRVLGDARAWLTTTVPQSTEDATFRLLGLVWAGASATDVAAARRDLWKRQRPGGGWPQLPAYAPDAYSTGEALYALHESGTPAADAAWGKGIGFLLTSQARDGTWQVRTRMISPAEVSPPYFTTGFPYKRDEYISYAASAWATMALLGALPKADAPTLLPPPITEAAPADLRPFRSALFDSAEQFASSLKGDVNLTTAAGTTLLMAAASDADKVALLLSRGASPLFRAPSGYDAMTVAASYPGGAPAMRALIDAGAGVEPPDGVKATRSPLLFASMSGDLDSVSLLLSKGASANLASAAGDTPISEAITFGRADVVQTLIAAGANVHLVERTGVNLLHWATITNRADVVPTLARAGVDINAMDEAGYTPLMYAATIDFGDTATLRALLAAGARPAIANPSGRTPLQQARRLGHLQLAEALAGHP